MISFVLFFRSPTNEVSIFIFFIKQNIELTFISKKAITVVLTRLVFLLVVLEIIKHLVYCAVLIPVCL